MTELMAAQSWAEWSMEQESEGFCGCFGEYVCDGCALAIDDASLLARIERLDSRLTAIEGVLLA